MRTTLIAVSMLALAGCSTVASEGAQGLTSTGEPVAANISVDTITKTGTVSIYSPAGWSCSAQVGAPEAHEKHIRTVPATCSNGDAGTFLISGNKAAQKLGLSFQLVSGKVGQVVFEG